MLINSEEYDLEILHWLNNLAQSYMQNQRSSNSSNFFYWYGSTCVFKHCLI